MRPFRLSPESGKSARIPYQYQSKPRFQRSNSNQNPKDSTLTRCYLQSPVITRPSTVAVGVDDHRGGANFVSIALHDARFCHRMRSSAVEYKPAAVFGTIRSEAWEALTRPLGVTV